MDLKTKCREHITWSQISKETIFQRIHNSQTRNAKRRKALKQSGLTRKARLPFPLKNACNLSKWNLGDCSVLNGNRDQKVEISAWKLYIFIILARDSTKNTLAWVVVTQMKNSYENSARWSSIGKETDMRQLIHEIELLGGKIEIGRVFSRVGRSI